MKTFENTQSTYKRDNQQRTINRIQTVLMWTFIVVVEFGLILLFVKSLN